MTDHEDTKQRIHARNAASSHLLICLFFKKCLFAVLSGLRKVLHYEPYPAHASHHVLADADFERNF